MSIAEIVNDSLSHARPYIESYGLYAIGLGIFAETLLFAGVFVPGFSILVAAGFLAAEGALDPLATLSVAWAGGIAGDQASYQVGRWVGDRVLRGHEKVVDRLRRGLASEGILLLLWYHFVSPMRVVMPYLAGSLHYPRARWVVFDSLGLLLWIGFGFGIGYAAHGPLQRYGDTGYILVFAVVMAMILYTVVRLIRVMFCRDPGLVETELEEAAEALEIEQRLLHRIQDDALGEPMELDVAGHPGGVVAARSGESDAEGRANPDAPEVSPETPNEGATQADSEEPRRPVR